jgi:hypothetical protein
MLYPTRFQVRQSTVLVFVLLLMGSVLYEVTRTESGARQHAARTQDISLPADQPTEHKIRPIVRPDYIGRASIASASARSVSTDEQLGVGTAAAATGTTLRTETVSNAGGGGLSNGSSAPGRVRSANVTGYAPAGMGGVGAWGGVSGMVRATPPKSAAPAKAPKAAAAKKEATPKKQQPGNSGGSNGGGGGGAIATATLLPGGFTTGAIEPGAVAGVQATAAASPAAAPAATPEPMSMFLMGSGLVALYGVRRRFQ